MWRDIGKFVVLVALVAIMVYCAWFDMWGVSVLSAVAFVIVARNCTAAFEPRPHHAHAHDETMNPASGSAAVPGSYSDSEGRPLYTPRI